MSLAPFLALEGPDGAGKTTLATRAAEILAPLGVRHVNRRQVSTNSAYAATLMEPLARMLWHSGDAPDLSDGFWAHLQAAWFTAHGEQVVAPALTSGPVLVDGWYFKLASRLPGQGWHADEIDHLFSRVRRPDHTILLDVDPEVLWERKAGRLRDAELGMHGTYTDLGRASFLDYQQQGLNRLRATAAAEGWHVMTIPVGEDPDTTAHCVAALIRDLITPAPNTSGERP
ncbi:thymidylate kinase [Kitasatospora xanthocidica]|uniref:Thymidylate kinase n=1 Tax=Kitasatospora xanthocidica TaxID=83382 RepID=A0A372ZVK7_9ACTN|nr:dTMP kinase [Kitasatospora xanthocidica]RGD59430.1 thymidylate kinase [Kitasatospora xanthocidica]